VRGAVGPRYHNLHVNRKEPSSYLLPPVHHERYGHSDPSRAVEIVNARLKIVLPPPRAATVDVPFHPSGGDPLLGQREVWFDSGLLRARVYQRARMPAGLRIRARPSSFRWTPLRSWTRAGRRP